MCQVREPVPGSHQLYANSLIPQSEILALSFFSNIHMYQESELFLFGLVFSERVCSSVVKNRCQYRRHRFDPWVGKIPWRRKW